MSFCQLCEREHQPREHEIPCRGCRRMTLDVHALCPVCKHDEWQQQQDYIGDRLMLRSLERGQ